MRKPASDAIWARSRAAPPPRNTNAPFSFSNGIRRQLFSLRRQEKQPALPCIQRNLKARQVRAVVNCENFFSRHGADFDDTVGRRIENDGRPGAIRKMVVVEQNSAAAIRMLKCADEIFSRIE